MKEFCSSSDSDWFVLIDAFKQYVVKSIEHEMNSLHTISEACLRLKTELNLSFSDSRQWQYFHLYIYTRVLQEKKQRKPLEPFLNDHSKKFKKDYNNSFRYQLIKYMRNIENCMQDVFSEIQFNNKFMIQKYYMIPETTYVQFKANHELISDEDAKVIINTTSTPSKYSYQYTPMYTYI
jgi:hypothetical protein